MGGGGDTKKTVGQITQELVNTLCQNANKWVTPPISVPTNATFDDLEQILKAAARQGFKGQYGYDYNGTESKPVGAAPGTKVSASEGLCNITTDEGSQIFDYVKTVLWPATGITSAWIKDSASADLVTQGKALYLLATGNSWFVAPFARQYDSPQVEENSYRTDSIFVYCNASLTIDGTTVKYTLIHYLGTYFEVTSPTKSVRNNLIATLVNRANDLLKEQGLPVVSVPGTPDVQDIETILGKVASNQFSKQYGFQYTANTTKPPDMAPNNVIAGSDVLCYVPNKETDVLTNYVDTKILSVMNLPDWMAVPAGAALTKQAIALFKNPTGNSWSQAPYGLSYNSAILEENSYKTTAVLIYTNASLTEGGITAEITFIFYMGVYYQIVSPNLVATQGLMKELCNNANALLDQPISINTPPTIQDLKKILGTFTPSAFERLFSFPYLGNNTVPDDIVRGKKPISNEALMYIPGGDINNLQNYINSQIISGLGLPSWVKNIARADLLETMSELAGQSKVNAWNYSKFMNPYDNTADSRGNGIKTCAVIAFTNAKVVENGQTIVLTIFYYLGIYYAISPGDSPFGDFAAQSRGAKGRTAPKGSRRVLEIY